MVQNPRMEQEDRELERQERQRLHRRAFLRRRIHDMINLFLDYVRQNVHREVGTVIYKSSIIILN